MTCREYSKASSIAGTISDELYILNDLLTCKMNCVCDCILSTLIRSLLKHTLFPAIRNSLPGVIPAITKVLCENDVDEL